MCVCVCACVFVCVYMWYICVLCVYFSERNRLFLVDEDRSFRLVIGKRSDVGGHSKTQNASWSG